MSITATDTSLLIEKKTYLNRILQSKNLSIQMRGFFVYLAGVLGIEPRNVWFRARCLTAWLYPIIQRV